MKGNNMNKGIIQWAGMVALVFLCVAACQVGRAQETTVTTPPTILTESPQPVLTITTPEDIKTEQTVLTTAQKWGVAFSGSNEVFAVNPYWAPTQRVQVGPEISYMGGR